MSCTMDTLMTDNLYLDIVARFVGPATAVNIHCVVPPRVEVRTVGESVTELGRRLACLVLTRQQLDLMHRSPPRVFLTGPPGTGKTIMLVLQGLRWLLQGHDVHVISKDHASLATSLMIQHQLQMTLRADPTASPTPGAVWLHDFTRKSDIDSAFSDLLGAVRKDTLCVLMDETHVHASYDKMSDSIQEKLVTALTGRVSNLYLWCAGCDHRYIPSDLQEEPLTTPLRCAPSVLREVEPGVDEWTGVVNSYSDSGLPAPGDGPSVIRLSHRGNAHTGRWPLDCAQCGHEVAAELRRLGVGSGGHYVTSSPVSMAYRDVFVLVGSAGLQDDAGSVTSAASGVVQGLRAAGIPVCVLKWRDREDDRAGWEGRLADVAVARTDWVTVADWESVQGLERRVLVWLAGALDKGWDVYHFDRLHALSRCTTQLVVVAPPFDGR